MTGHGHVYITVTVNTTRHICFHFWRIEIRGSCYILTQIIRYYFFGTSTLKNEVTSSSETSSTFYISTQYDNYKAPQIASITSFQDFTAKCSSRGYLGCAMDTPPWYIMIQWIHLHESHATVDTSPWYIMLQWIHLHDTSCYSRYISMIWTSTLKMEAAQSPKRWFPPT